MSLWFRVIVSVRRRWRKRGWQMWLKKAAPKAQRPKNIALQCAVPVPFLFSTLLVWNSNLFPGCKREEELIFTKSVFLCRNGNDTSVRVMNLWSRSQGTYRYMMAVTVSRSYCSIEVLHFDVFGITVNLQETESKWQPELTTNLAQVRWEWKGNKTLGLGHKN